MNFFVILIITVLVAIGWYAALRFLGPKSAVQRRDPATAERRFDWIRALRDLSFFFILYFILITVLVFGAALVFALIDPPNKNNFAESFTQLVGTVAQDKGVLSASSIWGALVMVVGAVLAVGISQRMARGRFILELGLRYYKALPLDVLMGFVLGPLLFAVVFLLEQVTGWLVGSIGPNYNWGELLLWAGVCLCVAVGEELIVRGYILQTLNMAFGGSTAVVVSSVFWGLTHLLNPNSSPLAAVNIAFAGLIFAYAYIITNNLWLPIAFHFSWNFAEGAIFGYPVSGYLMPAPVIQSLVEGPDAATGGRFGPEGGIMGILAIFLGGLLLYGWSKTRPPVK